LPAVLLHTEHVTAALPPRGRELLDVLGVSDTLELMRKFGGKRRCVPCKLVEGEPQQIVAALGRDLAEKLVDAMPGSRIEPPMLVSVERLLRDNAIRADYDSGEFTTDQLVDRYRVTNRHLRKGAQGKHEHSAAAAGGCRA